MEGCGQEGKFGSDINQAPNKEPAGGELLFQDAEGGLAEYLTPGVPAPGSVRAHPTSMLPDQSIGRADPQCASGMHVLGANPVSRTSAAHGP